MEVIRKPKSKISIQTASFNDIGRIILTHKPGYNLRPLVIWYDKSNVYYLNCKSGEVVNSDGEIIKRELPENSVEFTYNGKASYVDVSNIQVMNKDDFEKIYGALDSENIKPKIYNLTNQKAKEILIKMNEFIQKGDYTFQKTKIADIKKLKNKKLKVILESEVLCSKTAKIQDEIIDKSLKCIFSNVVDALGVEAPEYWENDKSNFKDSFAFGILSRDLGSFLTNYQKKKQEVLEEKTLKQEDNNTQKVVEKEDNESALDISLD
ncbi:hypothetical protein GE118_04145 [Mycoplasma sp. NEAQ87857]|uniref:Mbov_0400 family ICE element protein n=1 Tax=Mycoplasma sp. NEAQ87857 TaxID=2683967 RepID=UPI00131667BE|nr:hypothetical protein [Mycoplasma sp. NEAQ87857]QGZ97967.1 hypothetical protein GE118_04145 [Mycoplasma sp. NEAQ87857]